MSQLLIGNTCKSFASFSPFLQLFFPCVCLCPIHTFQDTPTGYTHMLFPSLLRSLSLSLSRSLSLTHTLTHIKTCSLSHSALSSFTAKERGGGEVRLEGLKYKEEKKRPAAFLLALSDCLSERHKEANK